MFFNCPCSFCQSSSDYVLIIVIGLLSMLTRYHLLVQTAGLGRVTITGDWEAGTRASVCTRVRVGDHVPMWGRVLTIVPVSTCHWSTTNNLTICPEHFMIMFQTPLPVHNRWPWIWDRFFVNPHIPHPIRLITILLSIYIRTKKIIWKSFLHMNLWSCYKVMAILVMQVIYTWKWKEIVDIFSM